MTLIEGAAGIDTISSDAFTNDGPINNINGGACREGSEVSELHHERQEVPGSLITNPL